MCQSAIGSKNQRRSALGLLVLSVLSAPLCFAHGLSRGARLEDSRQPVVFDSAVSPGQQTISFSQIATQTAGTNTALSATASSGLPVTFSSGNESICTIASSTSFTGYVVVLLGAGTCQVTATQGGNADYAPASPVTVSFNVSPSQVDGNDARQKLLDFIDSISGRMTMAGQHNREAEIGQPNWIQWIDQTTGDYPAVWGGDFLYEPPEIANRQNMINYLLSGAQNGAVIDLMYTPCPPTLSEGCWTWQGGVLSTLTDAQWADLTTPGGTLYGVWLQRLDAIAPYMQQVQNAGYPMLLRLIHEMNQGAFWYGGRPGPNGTALLYRITHDYLVNHWGIHNAVWVWDTQDILDKSTNSYDFAQYDPGSQYWDVMGFDFYDGHGFTTAKYNVVTAYAGNRPVAIGECEQLPTPAQLLAQPRWTYFLGWAELIQQYDTNAQIDSTYWAPSVLTENGNHPMPVIRSTVPVPVITATGMLSKVNGNYQMVVTVKNSGSVSAMNVQLTQATLGSAIGSNLPAMLGTIPAGGSATVTLTFPSAAGADGATVAERLSGIYSGGTLGASFRAVLP